MIPWRFFFVVLAILIACEIGGALYLWYRGHRWGNRE